MLCYVLCTVFQLMMACLLPTPTLADTSTAAVVRGERQAGNSLLSVAGAHQKRPRPALCLSVRLA